MLAINQELIDHLLNTYPNDQIAKYYLGGLYEERMRLFFRLPDGVKNIDIDNIDIDSVELGNKDIVAFMEFGRLNKADNSTERWILETLSKALNRPAFFINFADDYQHFKIRNVLTGSNHWINSRQELWGWRRKLKRARDSIEGGI